MKIDELVLAILRIDRAVLRGSDEGRAWLSIFNLWPGVGAEVESGEAWKTGVLAKALTQELSGDDDAAAAAYSAMLQRRDDVGLLAALLKAWMRGASEEDFDAAEDMARLVDSEIERDLIIKLMTWSLERGWHDRGARLYDRALEAAERASDESTLAALRESGDWFGRDRSITFGLQGGERAYRTDLVTKAERAGSERLREQFDDSLRGPWAETIQFGGPSSHREVQAAELQASWLGALWLLPQIWRQRARVVLTSPQTDRRESVSAIASWIAGGGAKISALLDRYGAELTATDVERLIEEGLQGGALVRDPRRWAETCLALWDLLPISLVHRLLDGFDPPSEPLRYGDDAARLQYSLFAALVFRDPERWHKAASRLDSGRLGQVVAVLHPSMAHMVQPALASVAVRSFMDVCATLPREEGGLIETGWRNAAALWAVADSGSRPDASEFRSMVPGSESARVAVEVAELTSHAKVRALRSQLVDRLEGDLSNARKGLFTGWDRNPASELALAMSVIGATNRAVDALTRTANSDDASADQRLSAIGAVRSLVDKRVLARDDVAPLVTHRPIVRFRFAKSSALQELEDVSRDEIESRFSVTIDVATRLLGATRSSDARTRIVAVRALGSTAPAHGQVQQLLDAALLAALYDPAEDVQAFAMRALVHGRIASEQLCELAMARAVVVFPELSRGSRAALAGAIAGASSNLPGIDSLHSVISEDRSPVVRYELRRSGLKTERRGVEDVQ